MLQLLCQCDVLWHTSRLLKTCRIPATVVSTYCHRLQALGECRHSRKHSAISGCMSALSRSMRFFSTTCSSVNPLPKYCKSRLSLSLHERRERGCGERGRAPREGRPPRPNAAMFGGTHSSATSRSGRILDGPRGGVRTDGTTRHSRSLHMRNERERGGRKLSERLNGEDRSG